MIGDFVDAGGPVILDGDLDLIANADYIIDIKLKNNCGEYFLQSVV